MTKGKGNGIVGIVIVDKNSPQPTTAIGVNLGTIVSHHSTQVTQQSETTVRMDIDATQDAIATLRNAGLHAAADILERELRSQQGS